MIEIIEKRERETEKLNSTRKEWISKNESITDARDKSREQGS